MVEFLFAILLFAIILVFATLIIVMVRQVAVVALIIIAPIAFALAILPNTRSLFTKWRKTFLSLLLLWPVVGVIMGASFLAQGIFNSIANSEKDRVMQTFWQISALAATVIPLVAIPSVMKGSLKSLGKLGGVVSGFAAGRVSAQRKAVGNAHKNTPWSQAMTAAKNSRKLNTQKLDRRINAKIGKKFGGGNGKSPGRISRLTGFGSAMDKMATGEYSEDKAHDDAKMKEAGDWYSASGADSWSSDDKKAALINGVDKNGQTLTAYQARVLLGKDAGNTMAELSSDADRAEVLAAINKRHVGNDGQRVRKAAISNAKDAKMAIGGGIVARYGLGEYTERGFNKAMVDNAQSQFSDADKMKNLTKDNMEYFHTLNGQEGSNGAFNSKETFRSGAQKIVDAGAQEEVKDLNVRSAILSATHPAVSPQSNDEEKSSIQPTPTPFSQSRSSTDGKRTESSFAPKQNDNPLPSGYSQTPSGFIIPDSPHNVRETVKFDNQEEKIDHSQPKRPKEADPQSRETPRPSKPSDTDPDPKPSNPSFYGVNESTSYTQGTREMPHDGELKLGPDDISFTGGKPPEK